MPIGPARMPFLQHMGELRKRAFVIVGVVIVATLVLYFVTDQIMTLILKPVMEAIPGSLVTLGVLDAMTVRFSLAFWSAVVVCSPIIIWQVMAFFLPALRPNERKWVMPTFAMMLVLFVAGVLFCYFLILKPSFGWLVGQNGEAMQLMAQAGNTLTVVEFFLLGFGVAFQTPIIVFYLVYFGIVPYKTLRENWRFVYVAIVVIAAGITPDWSPVSMGALSAAMIVLYEGSLVTCRIMLNKRIKAQRAAELAEDLEPEVA